MQKTVDLIVANVGKVLIGKQQQIKLSLACLFAQGHLLIEDLPGMGKTTMAHALAKVLGLSYSRIQFTSDLLPSDILGVSIYSKNTESFQLKHGAVFTNILLADEINRATPKSQSALLEAMEEQQVSIDGETHQLPQPFFVIATQNPLSHSGTFPLPESQLDRFLMRISLGYPEPAIERAILKGEGGRNRQRALTPVCDSRTLIALQKEVSKVHTSEEVISYVLSLMSYIRDHQTHGISTRASLGLLQAARAWAMCEDRNFVTPEDIQAVFPSVIAHRMQNASDAQACQKVLQSVSIR